MDEATRAFCVDLRTKYPNPISDRASRFEDCVLLFLDKETYYDNDYSLSRMTTEAYIRDPRFEVIMVSYKLGDAPMQTLTGTMQEIGSELAQLPWHRICLVVHNCAFDGAILSYIWQIRPRFMLCTERMAAPFFSNICGTSLAALAKQFNLPEKGTAVHDMKGKRRTDLTPQEFAEYAVYCQHDTWLCRELFFKLLPKLPYHELYSLHATLAMTVIPVLQLDKHVLQQMLVDESEQRRTIYERAIQLLGHPVTQETMKSILSSNDKFPALLQALGVDVPTKLNAKGEVTYALAKTDPGMEELLHCDDVLIKTLCEARLSAKSTQAESRAQRFLEIAERGAMPFPLAWCGADVTGRWSARDSINTQNMKRKGALRKAIKAPPGYKLVVADLSQIELRFGWWLAGEWDKLEAFSRGHDPYRQIMADTFNMDYNSIEKTSVDRQCGKTVQLSGIYQTGADKVRHTIRIQAGKGVTPEEAKQLITTYRRNHQHVVAAWELGERAIEALHANVDMELWQPGFAVVSGRNSPFGVPSIRKPDGMYLARPGVNYQWGTWPDGSKKKEWYYQRRKGKNFVKDFIYGGKTFQASTQGGARDVLSAATARIVRQLPYGWFIAGTIHDELVGVVPEKDAGAMAGLFRTELTRPIPWAPNLPLAVDIDIGDCYGELK